MPCPAETALTQYAICGNIQEICEGEPADIRVTVSLLNPDGGVIKDPTTEAFVVSGVVFQETFEQSEDGCWCTCPLSPNISTTDPNAALLPNNTGYQVQVVFEGRVVIDEVIVLNADDLAAMEPDTSSECDTCINICNLVDDFRLIPSQTFCERVEDCLPPETITPMAVADSVVTYTDEAGVVTTFDICQIVEDFCPESLTSLSSGPGSRQLTFVDENAVTTIIDLPPASTVTNNADGSWTHDDGEGNTVDIWSTSTDAGNLVAVGTDGGSLITAADICAAVIATCPAEAIDNGDGTFTITGNDGNSVTISGDTDTFGSLVDNGDGSFTWTSADGATTFTIPQGAVSALTDNADGSWTHDDGEGNTVTITTGSVADNGDGTSTVTFPDGTSAVVCTDCDHASIADNGDGTFTGTNPDGSTVTWVGDTDSFATVTDNGDGTFTATNADGSTVTWLAGAGGATSTLTDGTNEFTHTDGDGTSVTVPQATVVVDDAYTGSVTDSEGVVVPVISRLDDCRGNPIDVTAEQFQLLDEAESINLGTAQILEPNRTYTANTSPAPGDQVFCLDLTATNPSDCRDMEVLFLLRAGNIALRAYAGDLTGVKTTSTPTGTGVPTVDTQFPHCQGTCHVSGTNTAAHKITFPSGTEWYRTTLAPGASQTWEVCVSEFQRTTFFSPAYGDTAGDRIIQTARYQIDAFGWLK